MKKRIITAAILVPVLFLMLYAVPKQITVFVVGILCAIGAYELLYRTGLVRHMRMVAYSVIVAALVPVWCYYGMDSVWARFGLLAFVSVLFLEQMLAHTALRFEKLCVCAVAGVLVPYMLSSLTRILAPDGGRYAVLIPFVIAFLTDSGAYFIGCRFGKHKLAPTISPKKSIEGVIGGVVTAVIGMMLYCCVMQFIFGCSVHYGFALVYGILGSLAAVFGDLCFSVIKRQTGIKDYGNIIPGHGGVLDRFDSMLIVGPLVELLMVWLPVVVK